MALNNARVADIGFSALVGAESMKMHAYSAFTLLFMMNSSADPKVIRKHLAVRAADTGVIAKNTWESYVKGVEVAAGKFRTHLAADAEFLAIFDMDAEDAVDAVRVLYEGVNVVSGSDIRAWSKLDGLLPLDKEAAKREAKAAADAKKLAAGAGAAALFFAQNAADSSAIPDMAAGAPADPMAALAAILATLDEAATMKALEAVNARLATMAKAKAAAPKADPKAVAPVLADDKVVDARSALAAHFNRDALGSAAMSAKPPARPNKAA